MPDPTRIINMASAFYESCLLFAASDLGVFSELARHPNTDAEAIAGACGLDYRGARLMLDGCVALGLLQKTGETYNNTPESAMFLVPGCPGDLSGAIRYNRDVYQAWGKLPQLVRTGEPVEKPELHLGEDEKRTRTFVLSMHGRALGIGRILVPQIDLSGCSRILDVGGGPGTYSVLLAQKHPALSSIVLDLPGVANVAKELIAGVGMSGRVTTLPGDYHHTPFPKDMDAILFFGMLHQESPDSIRDLFRRAWEALRPGGRVYAMDMMTDASHTKPAFSALFAVNMALTTTNGWVFSDAELRGWFEETGFADFTVRPLPPPMPHWLATVRKPE